MSDWFTVDKGGLAAILERRGKSFAVFELVQNAWDSGATQVKILLEPIAGEPYAELAVEDDSPEGWADMCEAFTLFSRSRRASNPDKRGRFSLGEKLVLSLCRSASIATTQGTIHFDKDGRRRSNVCRNRGTRFTGEIRLNRSELNLLHNEIDRLIPPVATFFNGHSVPHVLAASLKRFEAKLPTEIADEDGNIRRTVRTCQVEAYPANGPGEILELGIPVCYADWPWRLNVLQKVPMGLERDSVTDAFRRALQVTAMNELAEWITPEEAGEAWAREATGDVRIAPAAMKLVITKRLGERAVIATPGDPLANANAEAGGYNVVHGGSLSADEWANIRKHDVLKTSSAIFPTPRPEAMAQAFENTRFCPACKRPL